MLVILKRWLNMITWNSKFHVVIAALKWSNLCHHQTQVLPRNISYHISHPLCWTELHLNKMKTKALCGACSSYMWRQIPMSHLPWESETGMRVRITVSISFCMLLCSVSMAQRNTDLFSSFIYIYIYSCFGDRISLWCSGWPWPQDVSQAGLTLAAVCWPALTKVQCPISCCSAHVHQYNQRV